MDQSGMMEGASPLIRLCSLGDSGIAWMYLDPHLFIPHPQKVGIGARCSNRATSTFTPGKQLITTDFEVPISQFTGAGFSQNSTVLFHCIDDSQNITLVVWKVGDSDFPAWTMGGPLILETNTAKSNTFRDCKTFTSHCCWNLPADEAKTSKKRVLPKSHPITSQNEQMKRFVCRDQIGKSTLSIKFIFARCIIVRGNRSLDSVAEMMR